jgi:hypothetical protein
MLKEDIDKYFTKNKKDIINYIQNRFFAKNIFDEEPDYFFSELYMFILERKNLIEDEVILKNFISNFIYMNTQWTNSQFREMGSKQKKKRFEEFIPELHETSYEGDIEDKVFNEIVMDELIVVNELYYQSLEKLEEKVIWEIFFIEKQNSIRKFAKYIGRSRSVADKYIKQLKNDLKLFYNNLKDNK